MSHMYIPPSMLRARTSWATVFPFLLTWTQKIPPRALNKCFRISAKIVPRHDSSKELDCKQEITWEAAITSERCILEVLIESIAKLITKKIKIKEMVLYLCHFSMWKFMLTIIVFNLIIKSVEIYKKISEIFFYIKLKFHSNQILRSSCNKNQKLLYRNYIIFLVSLKLFFL